MTGAQAPDALARLRQTMNNSQHYQYDKAELPLSLGLGEPDALLGGGLARRALHEIAPLAPIHFGAACGFVLALAALAGKHRGRDTLWIQTDMARCESGAPYGIGLDLFGLPSRRLLVLRARRPIDALFAMEEALKCRAIASVIAELPDDTADLTATRRLSLAARAHDGIGLLLRHRSTSAAERCDEPLGSRGKPGPARRLRRRRHDLVPTLSGEEPARPLWPVSCCVES